MLIGMLARCKRTGRSWALVVAQIAAIFSLPHSGWARRQNRLRNLTLIAGFLLPATMMATNPPPTGFSGAPGESTCANCHFHGTLTAGSGVTVSLAGGNTYTPGGGPVSVTVTVPSSGGFELTSRVLNDNSQAGILAATSPSDVITPTGSTIQYARETSTATSFPLMWTPPAASVGPVVMYVAAIYGGNTYSNMFTLTPAASAPPQTLSVSASTLTFAGTALGSQTVQVTSSGSPIPFTASVSPGATWLTATPATGGMTPMGLTVSANPAGLSIGTYTGTVTVASTGATNSPQTVGVTFNVTTAPPAATPNLISTPSLLSFTAATAGATVAAKTLAVTSSDASAVVFNAAPSKSSTWIAVTPSTGSAPASLSASVMTTGLATGTYHGSIMITSTGAANSPLTVPVTLTIGTTPPATVPLSFSQTVVVKQAGGMDEMLLTGTGSVNSSGNVTGGGRFIRYTPNSNSGPDHIVSSGTWTATSVVSFTAAGEGSGGVLVLNVNLSKSGGGADCTMRIASTGSDAGVRLTITGGASFMPTGVGQVSVTTSTGRGRGRGGDGGGTGGGESADSSGDN